MVLDTHADWAVTHREGHGFVVGGLGARPERPPHGHVRVAFRVGGICGTDIGMIRGGHGTMGASGGPLHEVVGTVMDAGDTDLPDGATVVGWAGDYRGLASAIDCRADQLAVVPPGLVASPRTAIVAQPLACVMCAMERIGDVDGQTVLVLGAGSVGLLFAAEAAAAGARVTVVDRADREALAEGFGADEFLRSDARDPELLADRRFAVVIEAIGHDRAVQAGAARFVGQNGTLYLFGVPDEEELTLPFHALFFRNARILSGVTTEHRRHLEAAIAKLDDARYRDLYVTDVFPVEAAHDAYERALTDDATRVKVLIDVES